MPSRSIHTITSDYRWRSSGSWTPERHLGQGTSCVLSIRCVHTVPVVSAHGIQPITTGHPQRQGLRRAGAVSRGKWGSLVLKIVLQQAPNGVVGCRLRSRPVPAHVVYRLTETPQLTRGNAFTRLRSWVRVPQRPLVVPVHGVDVDDRCDVVPRVVPRDSLTGECGQCRLVTYPCLATGLRRPMAGQSACCPRLRMRDR
jgi:hypothetical protein